MLDDSRIEAGHPLAGGGFVAFDVNTVTPPHDAGGMTAFLAGTLMIARLSLACRAGRRTGTRCFHVRRCSTVRVPAITGPAGNCQWLQRSIL